MKFINILTAKQIEKIEELAYTGMDIYNYQILYGKKQIYLSKSKIMLYQVFDILNRIKFNFKDYGFINGFKYTILNLFNVNRMKIKT